MKYIYVDGYNVINSWPILKETLKYSLQTSREKLIEILQNYASFNGYKIYLVFDGHMKKGNLENREKITNLCIIYTKEGETADSFIEKAVNDTGRKVDVCVVTSDSLEQQLAFQRGAVRMSSIEFYFDVIKVNGIIGEKTKGKHIEKRNNLSESIGEDVLIELEKIRRNH